MRAKLFLVLGGGCLVALTAAHLMSDAPAPRAANAPDAAPTAARAAPDPGLSLEVRRLQAEVRALSGAVARPAAAASAPEPRAELTAQERAAREQEQVARVEQDLGDRLRAERVDPAWDPAWAQDTERALAGALAEPSFSGLQLEHVTCGATMCRLGLTASEQVASVEGVVEELTSTPPFRNGGFVRFTGPRSLTMFVARKGHPLPPPPRA